MTGATSGIGQAAALALAAEPAEIGEVIAFLAGPRAGYITGATIPVTAAAPRSDRTMRP